MQMFQGIHAMPASIVSSPRKSARPECLAYSGTMRRDEFDSASAEHKAEFLAWCASRDVDTRRLPHAGEVATVQGSTVTVCYEDGTTQTVEEAAYTDIPRVVLGRF